MSKRPASHRPPDEIPAELREQYRLVLERFLRAPAVSAGAPRVMGLTSCYRGEGVSTVAAQLAVTAAAAGGRRVLLVDLNLARPALHQLFGVPSAPGLSEVVLECAEPATAIRSAGLMNLSLLTAGQPAADPICVYHSARLAGLVETLRRDFDLIVLDLPAAQEASAVLRLAGLVDGLVLVVEAERVSAEVAQKTKDLLIQANVCLLGVLLNKARQYVPRWLQRTL